MKGHHYVQDLPCLFGLLGAWVFVIHEKPLNVLLLLNYFPCIFAVFLVHHCSLRSLPGLFLVHFCRIFSVYASLRINITFIFRVFLAYFWRIFSAYGIFIIVYNGMNTIA